MWDVSVPLITYLPSAEWHCHYIITLHSYILGHCINYTSCVPAQPQSRGWRWRPSLFSPSGARQAAVSGRCPAQKLIVCVVYCNIIILYYYIALLLDYTCSFIFISRNNKECVCSFQPLSISMYFQNEKMLDNMPYKILNIQKQDVMCLACANFLVTAISTIT